MHAGKVADKTKEWSALIRPYISERRISAHRLQPERSALLVIDMQRFFLERGSHAFIPGSEDIIDNVRALVASYRQRSRPVLFTRHALLEDEDPGAMGRWWGDVLREDDTLSNIVDELKPLPEEEVIRKKQYSAFMGTELEDVLRRKDLSQLVIAGVQTHLCCETTAREAFMKGFDVFIVIDGTASKTEELHVAALRTLADGFAIPVTTEEVVQWLK